MQNQEPIWAIKDRLFNEAHTQELIRKAELAEGAASTLRKYGIRAVSLEQLATECRMRATQSTNQ